MRDHGFIIWQIHEKWKWTKLTNALQIRRHGVEKQCKKVHFVGVGKRSRSLERIRLLAALRTRRRSLFGAEILNSVAAPVQLISVPASVWIISAAASDDKFGQMALVFLGRCPTKFIEIRNCIQVWHVRAIRGSMLVFHALVTGDTITDIPHLLCLPPPSQSYLWSIRPSRIIINLQLYFPSPSPSCPPPPLLPPTYRPPPPLSFLLLPLSVLPLIHLSMSGYY